MHFKLEELIDYVIEYAFKAKGIEVSDEEREQIELNMCEDPNFEEFLKSCIGFDMWLASSNEKYPEIAKIRKQQVNLEEE